MIRPVCLVAFAAAKAVDPLSGGAGWLGAGLLGLVLGWLLLKHLPDKDKQITKFIEDKDRHIIAMSETYERKLNVIVASYEKENRETKDEFRAALNSVLSHCDREVGRVTEAIARLDQKRPQGRDG